MCVVVVVVVVVVSSRGKGRSGGPLPPNLIQINLVFFVSFFVFCFLFFSSVISFHSIRHARVLHVDRELKLVLDQSIWIRVWAQCAPSNACAHVFKLAARLAAVASFIN